jgi:hypothetical protein
MYGRPFQVPPPEGDLALRKISITGCSKPLNEVLTSTHEFSSNRVLFLQTSLFTSLRLQSEYFSAPKKNKDLKNRTYGVLLTTHCLLSL